MERSLAVQSRRRSPASVSRPVIWLLRAQGLLTAITGLSLLVAPELIPALFGSSLTPDAHLLCYMYASSELSLTFLSFAAMRLTAAATLRLCCMYFAVAHSVQGLVGLYALGQGLPTKILANSVAHLTIAALFAVAASSGRFGMIDAHPRSK